MRKRYVSIEALKINIDKTNVLSTSECWAYVLNELENHICTTQDPSQIDHYVKPNGGSFQVGC